MEQLEKTRKNYISNKLYFEQQPEFQTPSNDDSFMSESMDQSKIIETT